MISVKIPQLTLQQRPEQELLLHGLQSLEKQMMISRRNSKATRPMSWIKPSPVAWMPYSQSSTHLNTPHKLLLVLFTRWSMTLVDKHFKLPSTINLVELSKCNLLKCLRKNQKSSSQPIAKPGSMAATDAWSIMAKLRPVLRWCVSNFKHLNVYKLI